MPKLGHTGMVRDPEIVIIIMMIALRVMITMPVVGSYKWK